MFGSARRWSQARADLALTSWVEESLLVLAVFETRDSCLSLWTETDKEETDDLLLRFEVVFSKLMPHDAQQKHLIK